MRCHSATAGFYTGRHLSLRREIHTLEESLEAGVGAEGPWGGCWRNAFERFN